MIVSYFNRVFIWDKETGENHKTRRQNTYEVPLHMRRQSRPVAGRLVLGRGQDDVAQRSVLVDDLLH